VDKVKCLECENFYVDIERTKVGIVRHYSLFPYNAKGRCKLFTPPKKGKIITWASTTLKSTWGGINLKNVKEFGYCRVIKNMNQKKKTPAWCPIKGDKG
jgi:hypothetical protein